MSEENTTTNNSTDASATKTVIEVPLEKKKSISASSLVANAKKQNATNDKNNNDDKKQKETAITTDNNTNTSTNDDSKKAVKKDDEIKTVEVDKEVVVEVREKDGSTTEHNITTGVRTNSKTGVAPDLNYKSIVNKKRTFFELYCTKGSVSNYITFGILVIALVLYSSNPNVVAFHYLLSFGLFGFAGGFTNWLAVKMLFDKIGCGGIYLIGSGVIPRQFKEIRETVKTTIMATFFDQQYLGKYLNDRSKGLLDKIDIESRIKKIVDDPSTEEIMAKKLQEMAATPQGAFLAMVPVMMPGMTMRSIAAMMKPALAGFATEMATKMKDSFDITEFVSVDNVRDEIDELMTEKLKELTPPIVKKLMEDVIREHLGWLIIWGNIFGGGLGIISQALGYGISASA